MTKPRTVLSEQQARRLFLWNLGQLPTRSEDLRWENAHERNCSSRHEQPEDPDNGDACGRGGIDDGCLRRQQQWWWQHRCERAEHIGAYVDAVGPDCFGA